MRSLLSSDVQDESSEIGEVWTEKGKGTCWRQRRRRSRRQQAAETLGRSKCSKWQRNAARLRRTTHRRRSTVGSQSTLIMCRPSGAHFRAINRAGASSNVSVVIMNFTWERRVSWKRPPLQSPLLVVVTRTESWRHSYRERLIRKSEHQRSQTSKVLKRPGKFVSFFSPFCFLSGVVSEKFARVLCRRLVVIVRRPVHLTLRMSWSSPREAHTN